MRYIPGKDLKSVWQVFKLPIKDDWQLAFYIWLDQDAMLSNTGYEGPKYEAPYDGCYVSVPERHRVNTDGKMQRVSSDVFGEIHLLSGYIGGGYVAHEIQHFVQDWREAAYGPYLEDRDTEDLCALAGRITSKFWSKWHDAMELKVKEVMDNGTSYKGGSEEDQETDGKQKISDGDSSADQERDQAAPPREGVLGKPCSE